MATSHPNQAKMQAAVQRWIAEAQGRTNGAALLRQRADWVEQQLQALSRACDRDDAIPQHLTGLTAPDLICAHGELLSAATSFKAAA